MDNSKDFLQGTAVLMTSTIIVKILGAFFKIPLAGILGAEGMGYFMSGYSIFAPVSAIALGGITIAVSKTVAEIKNPITRHKLLVSSLFQFVSIGFVFSFLIYYLAPTIANFIGNDIACDIIKAVSPAIGLCFITAIFRGYYEGQKNMSPTGISQILEAIVRLLAGYSFALITIHRLTEEYTLTATIKGIIPSSNSHARSLILIEAAKFAVYGISLSLLLGVFYLIIYSGKKLPRKTATINTSNYPKVSYNAKLWKIILPATITALMGSLHTLIDLSTIQPYLTKSVNQYSSVYSSIFSQVIDQGYSLEALPNYLYGTYSGMALSIAGIIPSLTAAIGINTLPLIASSSSILSKDRLKSTIETIISYTAIIAFPCGIGMAVVAKDALALIFPHRQLEAMIAANILSYLSIGMIFTSLTIPLTSTLQGKGKFLLPIKIMVITSIIKYLLNITLMSLPLLNIAGAAISSTISGIIAFILSYISLVKVLNVKFSFTKILIKPLFSALCCGLSAWLVLNFLGDFGGKYLILTLSMAVGGIIYVSFTILTGSISLVELMNITKK